MNVDVSPSGKTLVFDLLGDLYSLPISGGDAVPLTSGRAWDQAPRFSPDGAHVYFVSDREGYKNIWRFTFADRSLKQITSSIGDIVGGPNWSQDGSRLLASRADVETLGAEFNLQAIDPDTGNMVPIDAPTEPWLDMDSFRPFRSPVKIFSAVESAGGTLYFSEFQLEENSQSRGLVRISSYDPNTKIRLAVTPIDVSYSEYKPQLSHDGHLLAYFRQYSDRRTEVRVLNRVTGHDTAVIELANADDAYYGATGDTRPNYAFTPDDQHLVYWHNGKIVKAALANGSSEIISFRVAVERRIWARIKPSVQHLSEHGKARVVRWPSVSRNGQTMSFAAIGYVWVMDLNTGSIRRLTNRNEFEFMPAISPDGMSIAYVSFARADIDYGSGRLVVADVDDGAPRDVLAVPNETYLLPKWSLDGSMIAIIREARQVSGVEAAFGWTSSTGGVFNEVAVAPASSDPNTWSIYSRFVDFDSTGEHLLFSYPRSSSETVLATASLDGGSLRTIASGAPEVAGITPAADLKHLALTRDDGTVWIVPFDSDVGGHYVSTLAAGARRISDGGGYYVDWNRSDEISFGFGQNVYRYQLSSNLSESLHIKVEFEEPQAEQPIAFTGARLITIAGGEGVEPLIDSGTIVFEGQRIIALGPVDKVSIPANAVIIDATEKTIVPGLLDTHYHRIGGPGLSALKLPNPSFSDRSAITYGVTAAWEPGGPMNDGVAATVDLQRAGRILGPRWSHSAMGAVGATGIGDPWKHLTSCAAALAAVEQHREFGVAVLKEYGTPMRQQRQWLLAAARQSGLGIVSHLQSFDDAMTRIVDGYTGGEHPYIPVPFYKDVFELLRQTGYIWTPNVTTTAGVIGTGRDIGSYYCRELSSKRSAQRCDDSETTSAVPYANHRVRRVAELVDVAHRNGSSIGVSGHSMTGLGLHMEIWYLWKGGMAIEDVLRAATIGNAEKLGLQQEIGTLEVGKMADFLVLDENPLDDILNTLSLKYTVQGGVVYDSTTAKKIDVSAIAAESAEKNLH